MKQLIVISNATVISDEAHIINMLFEEGMELFHVRKPEASLIEIHALLSDIDPLYHSRIVLPVNVLSQLPRLKWAGRKVHFFEQIRKETKAAIFTKWEEEGYTLSTSVHDDSAYKTLPNQFRSTFYSPVFDSISKQGYYGMKAENLNVLKWKRGIELIALGGINEANCQQALDYGFDGVAVLGSVWQSNDPLDTFKRIQKCVWNYSSLGVGV